MTTYPNLKNEPEILKTNSKDGQIRDLKYETENLKNQAEKKRL